MKNSNVFTSRFLQGIVLSLSIIALLSSCSKSSASSLYGTGSSVTKGGPGTNEVWIQGMAFTPVSITVSAGTTITWTNKDTAAHTVTSDSPLFDSGSIAPGGTFSVIFSVPGSFKYHCSFHPSMTATVIAN
jgi:plastocyanin